MNDEEMIQELVAESREHLSQIEPDLLELEKKGDAVSDDLLNRIFRAIHSIKGGFGFYGKKTIVDLSHSMENVLSRLRDREISADTDVVDVLLQSTDTLHTLLDDVASSDDVSIAKELEALKPYIKETARPKASSNAASGQKKKRGTQHTKKKTPQNTQENTQDSPHGIDIIDTTGIDSVDDIVTRLQQTHEDMTREQLTQAQRNGQYLYQVVIRPAPDVFDAKKTFKDLFDTWEHFGPLLSTKPSRQSLEKASRNDSVVQQDVSVLVATVLEPDLIEQALEIPQERIYTIDISGGTTSKNEQHTHRHKTAADTRPEKTSSEEGGAEVAKSTHAVEEAVRVKVGLLNNLMNYAGELVLARNQLMQAIQQSVVHSEQAETVVRNIMDHIEQAQEYYTQKNGARSTKVPDEVKQRLTASIKDSLNFPLHECFGLNAITQNVDMVTSVLQENIMKTRMQPISVVFSKFPRVIRDLARKLDKQIELQQYGQEVELDKSIIELLSDPLTHIIRNSADHGIEPPQQREKSGKPAQGTIVLKAYQEGGKVFIEVSDDGEGIDVERVKQKAIEKGLLDEQRVETISDKEVQQFIFSAGFSSAKAISEVSGRGVGMDVVKSNIEKLGGTVEMQSEFGKGTTITLALPLTLAIIPSLIVSAEQRRFAIPQVGLEEVVRIRANEITRRIERVHNAEVLRLRGTLLPLVRLATVLGLTPTIADPHSGEKKEDARSRWSDRRGTPEQQQKESDAHAKERRSGMPDRRSAVGNAVKIAILRVESNQFGLVVDDVHDSEEIVVKPLPGYLKGSTCFAGATIMGDGKVAMILDPSGIASMAQLRFEEIESVAQQRKKQQQRVHTALQENLLLFSIGSSERFAVNVSQVSRIEKRHRSEIEKVGDKEFLTYDDSSLQLFRFERFLPVQAPDTQLEELFVLIPTHAGERVGLVAAQVEDTVQTRITLDTQAVSGPGIRGTSIINDAMTVVVNMPELLETIGVTATTG